MDDGATISIEKLFSFPVSMFTPMCEINFAPLITRIESRITTITAVAKRVPKRFRRILARVYIGDN